MFLSTTVGCFESIGAEVEDKIRAAASASGEREGHGSFGKTLIGAKITSPVYLMLASMALLSVTLRACDMRKGP